MKNVSLDIIAFTTRGAALAEKLLKIYPQSRATVPERYCRGAIEPYIALDEWVKSCFKTGRTLVFIGAAGIAVRAIAPFVKDKTSDAAVICIDEDGENIIPLLSGHIGSANETAKKLAKELGGRAVITTATDRSGVFAIDEWAAQNNCIVANPAVIKIISSALLDGNEIGLQSDFPVKGDLPGGFSLNNTLPYCVKISVTNQKNNESADAPLAHTLIITPCIVVAGIGCRKNVSVEVLEDRLIQELIAANISPDAVGMIATIDLKSKEPGLLELKDKKKAIFKTYTAKELQKAKGEFEGSERVYQVTGVDNVCQRAVVCSGARLITGKSVGDGVTIALGILDWNVEF